MKILLISFILLSSIFNKDIILFNESQESLIINKFHSNEIYKNIEKEINEKVYEYEHRNVLNNRTNIVENKTLEDVKATYMRYRTFLNFAQNNKVAEVFMDENYEYDYIFFRTIDNHLFKTENPKFDTFRKTCLEYGIVVKDINDVFEAEVEIANSEVEIKEDSDLTFFLSFTCLCIIVLLMYINFYKIFSPKRKEKNKEKISLNKNDFSSKKEEQYQEEGIKTFKDIAGLTEVKEDVKTLVDFMVNREKYCNMGAKLPKGVIFYGPPGTGKTLLAKAIAGEAGVPFLYASGSDFIEEYVGRGAKRIRELFAEAKKQAPCIIFIDEIDAICCKRGGGENDGTSEDRKTINALLTEMDGYEELDNVLVIGATNRIEDLDPAVLRPGRFTNKYCVPLPESFEDRFKIIEIYAQNKKFDETVDLKKLAKETIGFSPAEIESILNEAAIIATRNKLNCINDESIEEAYNKSLFKGHVKKDNLSRRKEELELVAWHEAGHALTGLFFNNEVSKVTILASTTGAGGATFTVPSKLNLHSIEDLRKEVVCLYGGRCAEFMLYKDWKKITTGAYNDIEKATDIVYKMISMYGMDDEYGMLNMNRLGVKSEFILPKASKLSNELKDECVAILERNVDVLKEMVDLLLEKETIFEAELLELKKKIK